MGKKGIVIVLAGILGLFLIGLAFAQTTNPWTSDSFGSEKKVFLPTDSVYASSYTVCFGQNNFDLYIIKAGDLTAGMNLVDIRGQAQSVKTDSRGFMGITKIWSNITSGDYFVVLDCNNNSIYDSGEPTDVINNSGFSVGVIGDGIANIGADSPGNFTFSYDYDSGNKEINLLQIILSAEKEDISFKGLELQAGGSGNDVNDIEKIVVYADENNNGTKGRILGQGKFASDDGRITIGLNNFSVASGRAESVIISYVMKSFIEAKTYSVSLASISAIGVNSQQAVKFSGLPIDSGVLTIGRTKTCFGSIELSLSNSSVFTNESVTANTSGLTNCSIPVYIKLLSCDSNSSLCGCEGENCSCAFNAPEIAGSYGIFACADKNNDELYNSTGESGGASLVTVVKEVPLPVVNSSINGSANNANVSINNTITGSVIANQTSQVSGTSSLITILSIGMIVIFIILVIILIMLFKLAGKK